MFAIRGQLDKLIGPLGLFFKLELVSITQLILNNFLKFWYNKVIAKHDILCMIT